MLYSIVQEAFHLRVTYIHNFPRIVENQNNTRIPILSFITDSKINSPLSRNEKKSVSRNVYIKYCRLEHRVH